MAISFLLAYWRLLLIATLCGLLALQTWRLDQKTDDLNKIRTLTDEARKTSDDTINRLREAIPPMVEMARNNAVANYKKRFGVACGIRTGGVLPNYDSQAGFAERVDATTRESMATDETFVKACAADAQMVLFWQDWARSNNLKEK